MSQDNRFNFSSHSTAASPEKGEEQVVVFELAGEAYAVPVYRVQEIIRMQPITIIPRAPEYVEGMTNLRGQVIPVIDLVKRLGRGQAQHTKATRIMVAELPGQMVGMLVDNVISVAQLPKTSIEPPPPVVMSVDSEFILGLTQYRERLLILLNLDKILSREES